MNARPFLGFPQKGTWIACPRKPRWTLKMAWWGSLGFNLLANLSMNSRRGFPLLALFGGVLIGLVLIATLSIEIRNFLARRKTAQDLALADHAFGEQFPVELTIVVDDARIAHDRGVVWFADGLMGFSGEACAFVLAAGDLAPQWVKARRHPMGKELPHNAIVLLGAPKMAYFQVAPLFGHGKAYRERFGAFILANEPPGGERIWPPLERYQKEPKGLAVPR